MCEFAIKKHFTFLFLETDFFLLPRFSKNVFENKSNLTHSTIKNINPRLFVVFKNTKKNSRLFFLQ